MSSVTVERRRRGARPPAGMGAGLLLCAGGFDPSGGAGILADLRAARVAGAEAAAVLTAFTAQSSGRLFAARAVPAGWLRAQIEALERESSFCAVKTGMFASVATVAELASWYRGSGAGPLVVDPLLVSGDGTPIASRATRAAMVRHLLPLATLVTPNVREAGIFTGARLRSVADFERAARRIAALGARAVLIKGGHLSGAPTDLFFDGARARLLRGTRRIPGRWHGLGCHLASAIGARLCLGDPLPRAISISRRRLAEGMRSARRTRSGRLVPSWRGDPW